MPRDPDPTGPRRFYDRIIRHGTFVDRFAAGLVRRSLADYEETVVPAVLGLATARLDNIRARGHGVTPQSHAWLRALMVRINGTLADGLERSRAVIWKELGDFAALEADFVARAGMEAYRVPWKPASKSVVRNAVTTRPLHRGLGTGTEKLRDWFLGFVDRPSRAAVLARIQGGIVRGETTEQIVRGLHGTRALKYRDGILNRPRRAIRTLVRTAVTHVSAQAREEVYLANPDVVPTVVWVSTLDARVSLICADLDGREFRVGEGIRPPAHPDCRSDTVPGPKDAIFGTRAAAEGPVAASTALPTWLRTQSVEIQNQVLGVTRAQAWRAGKVTIEKFVAGNRVLTVGELQALGRL